jgi:hypothetical protein
VRSQWTSGEGEEEERGNNHQHRAMKWIMTILRRQVADRDAYTALQRSWMLTERALGEPSPTQTSAASRVS